jgi:hypothetical protein
VPGGKQFFGRFLGLGDGFAGGAGGHGDAVLSEQLLGLVFVDIHFKKVERPLKTIVAGNQLFTAHKSVISL